MKSVTIVLAAIVAYTAAIPAKPTIHAHVSRNLVAPANRIVGGEVAQRYQHPYQASVQWGFLDIHYHICGGSLISVDTVLTSGYCVPFNWGTYQVVLGQLIQGESNEDVQTIPVFRFILHPDFQSNSAVPSNDIAILKLARPALLTEAVQIIPLGNAEDAQAIDTAVLSGWGVTDYWEAIPSATLRRAELPRITFEACAHNLTSFLGTAEPLDETMICTGSGNGYGQSACFGDIGSPLVRKSNGKQVGIVSWGIAPCGLEGAPTVYTSVWSHIDWINEQINA